METEIIALIGAGIGIATGFGIAVLWIWYKFAKKIMGEE